MFDIGFLELSLIGIVALLVLGPERLPVAARAAGKWVGTAKRMIRDVTSEIDEEIKLTELKEQLAKERAQIDRATEHFESEVRQANEKFDEARSYDPFSDDAKSESKDSTKAPAEKQVKPIETDKASKTGAIADKSAG